MEADRATTDPAASEAKRVLQESEYDFPYHHLPNRTHGHLRAGRIFRGGAEYWVYMSQVSERVIGLGPSSVLDVGCGDGRLLQAVRLGLRGSSLSGIDLDARAVALAGAMTQAVDFRCGRIEDVEETFDVVTCVETLEHIDDAGEEEFLRSTAACVAPGGVMIVTVPSNALPVPAKHHRHYDVRSLTKVLDAACPLLEVLEVEEIIPHRPWLESLLRALSNRWYSIDIGMVNDAIARIHSQPVPPGGRGRHVIALLHRSTTV